MPEIRRKDCGLELPRDPESKYLSVPSALMEVAIA
jgi:hypothetical protein